MKIIGIVGGMGAGKSTVIALMNQEQPISYISADQIGHEILKKGQAAYEPVIQNFGEDILDASGEIVRRRLGEIVFKEPSKVQLLNQITHPLITKKILESIASFKEKAPGQHIVLEAALLLESGLVDLTDVVLAVYTDPEIRLKRVVMREGLDEAQIIQRFKAQKEWEELRRAADYVIDNSVSLEHTKEQIIAFLKKIEA